MQIAAELAEDPNHIVDMLAQCLEGKPEWAKVLIFIDQFEELFTLVHDEDTRRAFVDALAATCTSDKARVIITMRSDFADRCAEYPALNRLMQSSTESTFWLSRPNRGKLYEMITQPAAVTGLIFEEGLEWRILDDTGDEPGALALTAYALEQLWQERDAQMLAHAVYDAFGGVEGAIGAQAQQAFSKASLHAREAFRDVFRQLVEINPQTGVATRHRAPLDEVYTSKAARELIKELADQRLLVTGRDGQTEIVEVAHEALFRSWPALAAWIAEVKDDLVLLRQVINAAAEWATNDYDDAFRWPHERLILVYDMLERLGKPALDGDTQRFIEREYDRLMRELRAPLPEIENDEELRAFHRRRVYIGDRLNELGDCDLRPGVGVLTDTVPLIVSGGDSPMLSSTNGTIPTVREVRLWGDKLEHIGLPDIVFLEVSPPAEMWTMVDQNGEEHGPFALKPFYLAKYLVTYVQFETFVRAEDGFRTGRWYEGLAKKYDQLEVQNRPTSNHPRESINWYDAIAFCRWLNWKLNWADIPFNLTPDTIYDHQGLRLPTEWEWQFAAQNGVSENIYPWGQVWDSRKANTDENMLSRSTAVGLYNPSVSGFFDLAGNLFEWCLNEYRQIDALELSNKQRRAIRGGSWSNSQKYAATSFRFLGYNRLHNYGFRLLCTR
jgi:formylglycine-generating enzyme required for sulfatase activity